MLIYFKSSNQSVTLITLVAPGSKHCNNSTMGLIDWKHKGTIFTFIDHTKGNSCILSDDDKKKSNSTL